jgi:gamma-glutamylcyclotransferase (GGCT)/AIG2-like uncharacterized protein YtfP
MCGKQMNEPCPDNQYFGTGILKGFRWIISTHGYANIVKSEEDEVHGVVYKISEADELSLDKYEGIRNASYLKEMKNVEIGKTIYSCLVYIDPTETEGKPKEEYINRIKSGIADAELVPEYIERYIQKFIPCQ